MILGVFDFWEFWLTAYGLRLMDYGLWEMHRLV
jgi:hypothetical protein